MGYHLPFYALDAESHGVSGIGRYFVFLARTGTATGVANTAILAIDVKHHFVALYCGQQMAVAHIPQVGIGVVQRRELQGAVGSDFDARAEVVGEREPTRVGARAHALGTNVIFAHIAHCGAVEPHECGILAVGVVLYRSAAVVSDIFERRREQRLQTEARHGHFLARGERSVNIDGSAGIDGVAYGVR